MRRSFAPHGVEFSRRGLLRPVLAALVVLLLAVTAVAGGFAPRALAQPGTVTDISFENEEFVDGSRQQINVDWQVEGTAVPPVTVSIQLSEELRGYSDRFTMTGADGSIAGECVVTATDISCTVNDEYVADHPQNMRGSFHFFVEIRLNNETTEKHDFVVGGVTIPTTVEPAPDYTCLDNCEYYGQVGYKSGWVHNLTNDEIYWEVALPTSDTGIGKTIVVTDHLDTDVYEIVRGPEVREARSLSSTSDGWITPDFEIMDADLVTVSQGGTTVEFTSRAALDDSELDGAVYRVRWLVKVIDGLESNVRYTNSAEWTIAGETSDPVEGRVIRQGGGANVVGENEGRFTLTKELSGNTTLNPEFIVKYSVDGEAQEDIVLRAGETFHSDVLTEGVTISLDEVIPTEPSNISWASPVFVLPDGTTSERLELTFNRENQNLGAVTEIRLVNEATLRTGSFQVRKVVAGTGAPLLPADATFLVTYSYDAGPGFPAGSGQLEVAADGSLVSSEPLPAGAVVTLTEVAPGDVPGATWTAAEFSSATVEIVADEVVEVTVTNTLTEVPDEPTPPEPTDPDEPAPAPEKPQPAPEPHLADSGAPVGVLAMVTALGLIVAGGLMIAARQRA